jgi:hypothetical protein
MAWDILIRGGTVIDGSGRPGEPAEIAVADGSIARIGNALSGEAARVIDAAGLTVTRALSTSRPIPISCCRSDHATHTGALPSVVLRRSPDGSVGNAE